MDVRHSFPDGLGVTGSRGLYVGAVIGCSWTDPDPVVRLKSKINDLIDIEENCELYGGRKKK